MKQDSPKQIPENFVKLTKIGVQLTLNSKNKIKVKLSKSKFSAKMQSFEIKMLGRI
jgi:hypothetical protein